MSTETQETALQLVEEIQSEMSVKQVRAQVDKILALQREVMQEGIHYGVVPGTEKPTLLQPGAQKLNLTFRCNAKFTTERLDLPLSHREYIVEANIYHLSGRWVGQGHGSASTMESKYRWRNTDRKCPLCGKETVFKSKKDPGWFCWTKKGGCGAQFKEGDQTIEGQVVGKRENPDIADLYNTVLKMAVKRALVAASLNTFAASDIFSQDVEDLPPEILEGSGGNGHAKTTPPASGQQQTAQAKRDTPPPAASNKPPGRGIGERIKAINASALLTPEEHAQVKADIGKTSTPDLDAYLAGWEKDIDERAANKGFEEGGALEKRIAAAEAMEDR